MHRAISATLGVAALLAVPATASADSVIVKYKDGKTRTAVNQRAGVTEALGTVAATGAQVVEVSGDAAAAAKTLSRSAAVEYAEPNVELHAFATPNDARFGELYGPRVSWTRRKAGTSPASAASRPAAASRSGSSTPASTATTRISRARPSSARASSCSRTGSPRAPAPTRTTTIAAAGNDGDATLNYPAAYAEVVSVAATDRNDQRASFSNANADVEIAAAGVDVLSTKRGGGYVAFSGTSMATPHVAGVAAVIAARNPSYGQAQIRAKLQTSVDDLGAPGRDPQFGFGRVNLAKAAS